MCVPALKRTACVLRIRPRRNVLQGKMRPQVEEVQKEDRSGGKYLVRSSSFHKAVFSSQQTICKKHWEKEKWFTPEVSHSPLTLSLTSFPGPCLARTLLLMAIVIDVSRRKLELRDPALLAIHPTYHFQQAVFNAVNTNIIKHSPWGLERGLLR